MKCSYCGEGAKLVTGYEIYPHRPDLANLKVWSCAPCGAWVGTHKNSPDHKPLGRLANAELRKAKMAAHAVFDPLWKSGRMSRREAYSMLAQRMGISKEQAHIGMFDVDQCKAVVDLFSQKVVL